jgi:hypothetical protein
MLLPTSPNTRPRLASQPPGALKAPAFLASSAVAALLIMLSKHTPRAHHHLPPESRILLGFLALLAVRGGGAPWDEITMPFMPSGPDVDDGQRLLPHAASALASPHACILSPAVSALTIPAVLDAPFRDV